MRRLQLQSVLLEISYHLINQLDTLYHWLHLVLFYQYINTLITRSSLCTSVYISTFVKQYMSTWVHKSTSVQHSTSAHQHISTSVHQYNSTSVHQHISTSLWSHKALCVLSTHTSDGRHHGQLDCLVLSEHLLAGDPDVLILLLIFFYYYLIIWCYRPCESVESPALQDQAAGDWGEAEPGQTWGNMALVPSTWH